MTMRASFTCCLSGSNHARPSRHPHAVGCAACSPGVWCGDVSNCMHFHHRPASGLQIPHMQHLCVVAFVRVHPMSPSPPPFLPVHLRRHLRCCQGRCLRPRAPLTGGSGFSLTTCWATRRCTQAASQRIAPPCTWHTPSSESVTWRCAVCRLPPQLQRRATVCDCHCR
jgi:hypothetical protein